MKDIILNDPPKVRINGIVCPLRVDDVTTFKQFEELQQIAEPLFEKGEEGGVDMEQYMAMAKETLQLLLGDAYQSVFPTEAAKNNWYWHHQVLTQIPETVYAYRLNMVRDLTEDSKYLTEFPASPIMEEKGEKREENAHPKNGGGSFGSRFLSFFHRLFFWRKRDKR